jgi:hypothetical protein
MKAKYYLTKWFRQIVFFIGDLRREKSFPWVSTAVRKHLVSHLELQRVLKVAKHGDVGLHLDNDFLTNLTIPGIFKHAWLHTADAEYDDKNYGGLIVEATSDGVLEKCASIPFTTDYAILLRPLGLDTSQINGACIRAKQIIGASYDTNFRFDIEKQIEFYEDISSKSFAKKSLKDHEAILNSWDRGFSCSEVVAYCYWHVNNTLSIRREPVLGKEVILPTDFLEFNFEVVWASESLNTYKGKALRFSPRAREKISRYFTIRAVERSRAKLA